MQKTFSQRFTPQEIEICKQKLLKDLADINKKIKESKRKRLERERDFCPEQMYRNDGLICLNQSIKREIKIALRKIEKGTYGICSSCKQDIPLKRLEEYPKSTMCVTCMDIHTQ